MIVNLKEARSDRCTAAGYSCFVPAWWAVGCVRVQAREATPGEATIDQGLLRLHTRSQIRPRGRRVRRSIEGCCAGSGDDTQWH